MKNLLMTAGAALAFLGSTANAQPYGGRPGNGDRRDGSYQQGEGSRQDNGKYARDQNGRGPGRGAGQLERGGHLPDQYRSRNYMVRDYRRYGYSAPHVATLTIAPILAMSCWRPSPPV